MIKKISIIIPVYNEDQYIVKTIDEVIASNSLGLKKEIIVVDDRSTDRTLDNIKYQISNIKNTYQKSNIKQDKNKTILTIDTLTLILIAKEKNEGKGAALKMGLKQSTGDIVLIQDADLEYSPDDYPVLLKPFITNDADVVYGSRFISDRPHRILYFWHYVINVFLTLLSNMFTNLNLTDMETGFKAFKGKVIRGIVNKLQSQKFGFEPEVTARIAKIKNLKIFEVGISYSGRTYEEGKKIGWQDGFRALWEIVRYNIFD